MAEFKLYTISDRYIAWLRESNANVYANKSADEFFDRKYLGVVFLSVNTAILHRCLHQKKRIIKLLPKERRFEKV